MKIQYEKRPTMAQTFSRDLARCTCGKMFDAKKKVCPSCNKVFDKNFAAVVDRRTTKFFNIASTMFVDEDTVKISLVMAFLRYDEYKLFVSEECFRLCFKYHIKTRMSYMYEQPIFENGVNQSTREFKYKFVNITQPIDSYYFDIKLPPELIDDFFNKLGIENDRKEIPLSPLDLAWVNRIQDKTSTCLREKEYFNRISSRFAEVKDKLNYKKKELAAYLSDDKEKIRHFSHFKDLSGDNIKKEIIKLQETIQNDTLNQFKKARRLYNKCKKYYKTLEYDEAFMRERFEFYCDSSSVKADSLDPKYLKEYFQYPKAIVSAELIQSLFTNTDLIKNLIKYENINYLWAKFKPEEIKAIYDVFKTEKRVYDKIISCDSGFNYLMNDTTKMIKQLEVKGIKLKTKGKLKDLHDKATRALRKCTNSVYRYESLAFFEDYQEDNYVIKQALDSNTLWDIGDGMNICVGSYEKYCIESETVIAYILDDKKNYVGCLEFQMEYSDFGNKAYMLVQAKGYSNNRLSKKLQNMVLNYCEERNLKVNCYDIRIKRANENNAAITTNSILEAI